jgi:ParB family chromosome partitioning protein
MATKNKSVRIANVDATKAAFEILDVSNLVLDLENNRKFGMDDVSIEAFAAELKRDGVQTPIIVAKLDNGKHKVIAGHRRSVAAQKAGIKKIPAMVHQGLDKEQMFLLQVIENEQREEPSFIDRAIAMKRAMEEFQWTQTKVASVFKTYGAEVSKTLGLLKLPQELQKAIHDGEFTFKAAIALKNATPEAMALVAQATQAVSNMGGSKSRKEKAQINTDIVSQVAKQQPGSGVVDPKKKETKVKPEHSLSGPLEGSEGKNKESGYKKSADIIYAPETTEKRDQRMSDPQWVGYLNRLVAACGIKGYEVGILFKMLREHAQNPESKDFDNLLTVSAQFKSVDNSKK